jgi:hypothetical protein
VEVSFDVFRRRYGRSAASRDKNGSEIKKYAIFDRLKKGTPRSYEHQNQFASVDFIPSQNREDCMDRARLR